MTDGAQASLEAIIERIGGAYPNFSVTSRWGRRQLMLDRKMFATFSESDMSFKLADDRLEEAYAIAGAETWNPKGRANPSRSWVLIPASRREHWMPLALEAAAFLSKRGD